MAELNWRGETMKIYMLMILVSTIAALSHLNSKNQAPSRSADTASS
jgi:hypothetical protein